jgi:hypothetical protein
MGIPSVHVCVSYLYCVVPARLVSRPLPRRLNIPTVMQLLTLADVRDLVEKHLPEQYRRKSTWQHGFLVTLPVRSRNGFRILNVMK